MPHRFVVSGSTRVALAVGIIAGLSAFAAPLAAAALQRTFVASTGVDPPGPPFVDYSTRPCNLPLPCRTFNAAIGNTASGGEVVILDTAGYGPMVINKAVKIIGPSGVYGGISVQGGGVSPTTGIVINAGDTDNITLRGLDISGVPVTPPTPPFPLHGIDIQNAGAVHIEKSSIGNFSQDTSVCIKLNTAKNIRVFVVDSFLRECNTGIYANGSAVVPTRSSVIVDNTRIERGFNTGGTGGLARAIWMQGFMDVSVRNSVISRQDVSIQFDGLLAGGVSHLELVNSEITRATIGLLYSKAVGNSKGEISIVGSQIHGTGSPTVTPSGPIVVSNSAAIGQTTLVVTDSHIAYSGADGIVLANTAADNTTYLYFEMLRSQINNITGTALDVSATNGSKANVVLRDSEIAHAATGLKTSGTPGAGGYLAASLVRSNLNALTKAVDHGFGTIRLDSSHVVFNANDFVNNGSPTIVSNGYNMVHDNTNASGFVYIIPSVIGLK